MPQSGTKGPVPQQWMRRIDAVARQRHWCEEEAMRLLRRGRDSASAWKERCLAAFLLEMLVDRMPPDDGSSVKRFLQCLGLAGEGQQRSLDEDLRRQGFRSGDPPRVARQLQMRLGRHGPLHSALRRDPSDPRALSLLSGLLETEWRLQMARFLIPPEAVVERIRRCTRTSCGLLDTDVDEHPFFQAETSRAYSRLPAYEAAVVDGLLEKGEIWWVDDATSSRLGSLVEYPLGSIVLIVRPPGSDLELELKRAGRRGPNPLRVFFSRQGRQIPKSHRLDCGAPSRQLRFEAGAATALSRLYRISQGREAPLGLPVSLRCVHSVPAPGGGETLLLAYLSDPEQYGPSFEQLRVQLEQVLQAYEEEDEWEPLPLGGDIGRATLFLTQSAPGQMLLCGTSSFRLDRLAGYLEEGGYQEYCRQLGAEHPGGEEAFQDLLLECVLGQWTEPAGLSSPGGQRIAAVLGANRGHCDATYLKLLDQAARLWGCVLAVRGAASGESFVVRNIGLRSFWSGGERRVQLVFLDHDALNLIPSDEEFYSPSQVFRNTYLDWKALLGGPLGATNWLPESRRPLQHLEGLKGYLERIYAIDQPTAERGLEAFHLSLAESYRRTQQAVQSDPRLGDMFHPGFRHRLRCWDRAAREYLAAGDNPQALAEWRATTLRRLREEGFDADLAEDYLRCPARSVAFVRRFSFLWEP